MDDLAPNPNKGKNKIIFEKLNNIQAEAKFIDIKDKGGVYMFFNLINGNCERWNYKNRNIK